MDRITLSGWGVFAVEFDVAGRIQELCKCRSWTYYRLAKESGIPYSTLSTMLRKTNTPSIPSLTKLCEGFGITLSQFFSEGKEAENLMQDQKGCLTLWNQLDMRSRELAMIYMRGLLDRQEAETVSKAKK